MTAPSIPLPDPAQITRWSELTETLRALHLACGRPTYDALSARCGLPKSAISYLIGKNAVRRPSEASVLRFVRGCLSYRSIDGTRSAHQLAEFSRLWTRLPEEDDAAESAHLVPHPPSEFNPSAGSISARSTGPRRRLVAALGIAALLLVGGSAAAAWAATHPGAPSPDPAPEVAKTPALVRPAGQTCTEAVEPQRDTRLDRTWPTVFYCRNTPTVVFAHPRDDHRPIATLDSTRSWFTCWTYGRAADGSATADVWYYTQGDDDLAPAPGWEDWGFVSAGDLPGGAHPATGVRRCDFSGG